MSKTPPSPEHLALLRLDQALAPLSPPEAERVLRWALLRFCPDVVVLEHGASPCKSAGYDPRGAPGAPDERRKIDAWLEASRAGPKGPPECDAGGALPHG